MLEPSDRMEPALATAFAVGRARLGGDLHDGVSAPLACSRLSATCDELLLSLVPNGVPDGIALVATGGWGRREMCPQSDLDLLILTDDPSGSEPFADRLLYPMWDAKIKVGHAVREPASMEELARGDVKTATALLDARLVAGSRELFDRLVSARRRAIAPGGDSTRFVRQLVDERDRRHRRFGDSIYQLEPNIKQGIGGLRDLATTLWVAQVRFGVVETGALVRSGQLTSRQASVLEGCRDFFLRVRCLVQIHTGRASDQLTFEVQEAIGPLLYPDALPSPGKPAVAPSVEALMREYYVHASGVTQVMAQLFEAALTPRRRRPSVARIDGSFLVFAGKVSVATSDVFDRRPAEMLRAFRAARQLEIPIHWHTRELIAERALETELDLSGDAEAATHFVQALVDLSDTRRPTLLEEMHRVGLVAAIIPEFRACTGRVQHDLYHVYTVDQHQLYAVNLLKRIARGEHPDLGVATTVYGELVDVRVVFLATLLHDVGKPLGKGHSESGAKIARAAAIRLGLDSASADRAALLVRHHLTMSHVSQRRDLSDPDVVRRFAAHVGDLTTLRELFLLTLCDTAMTAPGNLSPWKQQLLVELYTQTRRLFVGDGPAETPDIASNANQTRVRTRALLEEAGHTRGAEAVVDVDEHVASALSPRQLYRVLVLLEQTETDGFVTSLRSFPLKGHSEIAVVAPNRPGSLAEVTGALAVARIDVTGAVIGTVGGAAANLFFVRDTEGKALVASDPRWDAFQTELTALVKAGGNSEARLAERLSSRREDRLPPRVTPEVVTQLAFADGASDHYSVLEVFTQDRVGLLSDIAGFLLATNIEVHLAKVSTEGERAADVFYVLDGGSGGKLNAERCEQVVRELAEVLR